jgi:hypothetical protein
MGRESSLLLKSWRNGMSTKPNARSLDPSSLLFRICIGGSALAFLVGIIFGNMFFEGPGFKDSFSSYYYSPYVGHVFVGGACILGTLLMIYRYEPWDHIWSFVAGACLILLAIFPRTDPSIAHPNAQQTDIGIAHEVFSIGFLLAIVILVVYLFTLSDENASLKQAIVHKNNWFSTAFSTIIRPFTVFSPIRRSVQNAPSGKKLSRNRVYVVVGGLMFLTLVLCAIDQRFLPQLESYNPVLWSEALTLFFFFVAWIVKGGVILIDENADGFRTSFQSIFSVKDSQAKTIPSSTSAIGLSDTSHLTPELPFDNQSKQGASPT